LPKRLAANCPRLPAGGGEGGGGGDDDDDDVRDGDRKGKGERERRPEWLERFATELTSSAAAMD